MFQLIITLVAIALTAAMGAVTVNYLPSWSGASVSVERQVRTSLPLLENAYDVATRTADGTAPSVLAQPDGGFSANFLPLIKFAPPAPGGYSWRYGQHPDDGSHYANLHYFCLAPEGRLSEGVTRGLYRGIAEFSRDQAFVHTTCGVPATLPMPTGDWASSPRVITFYVAYVPGIEK